MVTESAQRPTAGAVLIACAQIADSAGGPAAMLASALRQADARLREPMRLAVVGQIKRGKSTLVNALLGEEVTATGPLELTFTVAEIRYAPTPLTIVHYRDGTPSTPFSPRQFHELTIRDSSTTAHLSRIRKVEHGLPNELLHAFRLVDTPGLGSVHYTDSANTRDILGIASIADGAERYATATALAESGRSADDVHRDSLAEVDLADAVLYLFSRALHENDQTAVEQFMGSVGGSATPLKAFGVLSRCDQYWPDLDQPDDADALDYDPMVVGQRLADQLQRHEEARRVFYTVVPIAGLLAMGACRLTPLHHGWIKQLVGDDSGRTAIEHLRDAGRFSTAPSLARVTLPVEHRRSLVELLGAWGLALACRHVSQNATLPQLRQCLVDRSGITRLRDLIINHFGNRAGLLKLDSAIKQARGAIWHHRQQAREQGVAPAAEVDEVATELERLYDRVPGFAELRSLARYYNGELRLEDAELTALQQVTGEFGRGHAARLGLPADASPAEIEVAARSAVEHWACRVQDPLLDPPTASVARDLMRGYERIAARAQRARLSPQAIDDTELEID